MCSNFIRLEELKIYIEDVEHTIKVSDLQPDTTLNMYLRKKANLTGTKNMCLEGGCGACIVAVSKIDTVTNEETIFAVNSCLVPIYMCSQWKIYTIETIGHRNSGYHPIQKALVQFNGTQCGFCSSGMLMNMYALYQSGNFTMKDVENSFGGNICRCTGYRSILSAFKSLASDSSSKLIGTYCDIEDIPICNKSLENCRLQCKISCIQKRQPRYYDFGNLKWLKVFSINEILDILENNTNGSYMIVGGNTATGVYKKLKEPDTYIDITGVAALLEHHVNKSNLILGANMTLTNAMNTFYKLSKENENFAYLKKLGDHIDLIANVPVRNTGTLAGNLFVKHEHPEFPSDVFLLLETVGVTMTIIGTDRQDIVVNIMEFLSLDMTGKLLKNIILPTLDNSYKFESYKIMPRAQNAHALVNAGFLFSFSNDHVIKSARIVFGSINSTFVHAINSENYLIGKNPFDDQILQNLFRVLENEIDPDYVLPDPSPEFRKMLAISLCYKYILSIAPDDKISKRNVSGGLKQVRPISSGVQEFETNKSLYPITQPISKIEALAQCTGSAKYIMDFPDLPEQLYAAFVVAKAEPYSIISKIDPADALKMEGVVAFYDKNDIPGENNFTVVEGLPTFLSRSEEIFCSGVIQYYFQPVGLIVATSQEVAEKTVDMVKISYLEGKRKPLISIRDILKTKAEDKITLKGKVTATNKGSDVKRIIKGTLDIYSQYHYTMETQCCVVIPVEDGLDIYPSSQTINLIQAAAAKALDISMNKINVTVRRLGGGYGSKITRSSLISTAAAIAAYKLQKPVKLSMPLTTNMNIIGKRQPFSIDYEVGVNDNGRIQYLNASMYSDLGSNGGNDDLSFLILSDMGATYRRDTWNLTMYTTQTDIEPGTFCRAPGSTEAVTSAASIMEHIAIVLNLDPLNVHYENIDKNNTDIAKYLDELIKWANVERRTKEVNEFNQHNRWVKKGIAVVPMVFPLLLFGYWNSLVSIYHGDGTVAVSHAGIEMGQGINTKVAQVCAHSFEIPVDQVTIKPTNSLVSPNSETSGGSITSESVCYATLKACEILKERMKPIKEKMSNPTWKELVKQCRKENIDLSASYLFNTSLPDVHKYLIYGATCVEVEVDILTGLYQVKRVDLLEDTGDSVSPQIDIGQVEGAFVMGMGYWTSEQLIYSDKGELLTNRTWNYKPPGVKDIPIDFRVKFPKNNPNDLSILKSKATAEPPLCMSCGVSFAIRNAVMDARKEANPNAEKWFAIDGPSTVENTFINSLNDYKNYNL